MKEGFGRTSVEVMKLKQTYLKYLCYNLHYKAITSNFNTVYLSYHHTCVTYNVTYIVLSQYMGYLT